MTKKKCLAPGLTPGQEYKDQQLSPFELKNPAGIKKNREEVGNGH